jgi:hypothetical protein
LRGAKNAKNEDDDDDEGQSGRATPVSRVSKRDGSQSQISDGRGASASAIQPDLPQLVESSRSHQEFYELLTTCYIPMETWYTRTIIDKVFVSAHINSAPQTKVFYRLTDYPLQTFRNHPSLLQHQMMYFTSSRQYIRGFCLRAR